MLELIGLADKLLSDGNPDAYDLTREQIESEGAGLAGGGALFSVQPLKKPVDEDLDIFGDSAPAVPVSTSLSVHSATAMSTAATPNPRTMSTVVEWEVKWGKTDPEESKQAEQSGRVQGAEGAVTGPHANGAMFEWTQQGLFARRTGTQARRTGAAAAQASNAPFYSVERIDFELYE